MSLFTRAGQNLPYNSKMAHSVKGLLFRCKKTKKQKKREKNLTLSPTKNEVVIDNNNIIIIQKFL